MILISNKELYEYRNDPLKSNDAQKSSIAAKDLNNVSNVKIIEESFLNTKVDDSQEEQAHSTISLNTQDLIVDSNTLERNILDPNIYATLEEGRAYLEDREKHRSRFIKEIQDKGLNLTGDRPTIRKLNY